MFESINKRVKHCRNLAGLTQSEAAAKMGMKCSTYSQMERTGDISGTRLVMLSEIFGVEPEYLLTGTIRTEDTKPVNYNDIMTEKKSNGLLNQPKEITSEKFAPIFVPTKNEENLIKIIRNLPKDSHDEVIKFIEEQYKKSKRK